MNNGSVAARFFSPSTKIGRLRSWLLDRIKQKREEHTTPTTIRFLFYEAVMAELVSKVKTSSRRPDQIISEAMTHLRDAGLVGSEEIVDRTRSVTDFTGYESIREGLIAHIPHVRIDRWGDDHAPLLVVESESLAGLLEPIAYKYGLVLVPLRGQSSRAFLANDIAPYVKAGHDRVFYLGDYDKAGDDIRNNARKRTEHYAKREVDLSIIALTAEQIDEYNLPQIEKKDGRDGKVRLVTETEAMPQLILMELLTDTLDHLLPSPLAEIETAEQAQRDVMARLLAE